MRRAIACVAPHPRKICVVTGSRADYGLLRPLLGQITAAPVLKLQLVATGMHLAERYGATWRNIESDGFKIDRKVEMLKAGDSPADIAKSTAAGVAGFADVLNELAPDLLVLLGDRFEIFAAAIAALPAAIPIAHIHGGELTEGAFDESIRHALTKMSHLHFTAAAEYARRVIQMGESPERVFTVGALGLDQIGSVEVMTRKELEERLGISLSEPVFLVTYHPVTLELARVGSSIRALLDALNDFPHALVIFTGVNADTGNREIDRQVREFVARNSKRAVHFDSLGSTLYINAMHHCSVVIGNSSSGIIEAPFLKKPTVNIGDRQKGRLFASSIVNCPEDRASISKAIKLALSEEFCSDLRFSNYPYGTPGASARILARIVAALPDITITKKFYDIR